MLVAGRFCPVLHPVTFISFSDHSDPSGTIPDHSIHSGNQPGAFAISTSSGPSLLLIHRSTLTLLFRLSFIVSNCLVVLKPCTASLAPFRLMSLSSFQYSHKYKVPFRPLVLPVVQISNLSCLPYLTMRSQHTSPYFWHEPSSFHLWNLSGLPPPHFLSALP